MIELKVMTSRQLFLKREVDLVVLPGSEGQLGVLPGHTPLITSLREGPIRYKIGEEEERIFTTGGYAHIQPHGVTLLLEEVSRQEGE